jgi:DNA-binding transcriptional LysR family regulator
LKKRVKVLIKTMMGDYGSTMSIHHIELFYYVAKHGGISEAIRHMPYGIQQPAMSAQILRLEDDLRVKLFTRRPFSLTPPGVKLYQFIQPFFANLETVAAELHPDVLPHLRIGAPELVFRDHLPDLLNDLRPRFPRLKISLRSGYQHQLESWLEQREIDLALTPLETNPPASLKMVSLLHLPLVLLVPHRSPIKAATDLWTRDKIEDPLICLPLTETTSKNFQQGLARLGVDWPPSVEASSLEVINTYVLNGYGIGLSVTIPKKPFPHTLRVLPLDGFKPVELGALWYGEPNSVEKAFLEEIQRRASNLGC